MILATNIKTGAFVQKIVNNDYVFLTFRWRMTMTTFIIGFSVEKY